MNKKVLFVGTFGATIILLLASFSSVVGTHVVKSMNERNSPLFSVRVNRAVDKGYRSSCNFIGKGNDKIIPLPKLDDINEVMGKARELWEKLKDDPTSLKKVRVLLEKIRNKPQFLYKLQGLKGKILEKNQHTMECTMGGPTCSGVQCFLILLLAIIILFLLPFLIPFAVIASLILPTCIPLCAILTIGSICS
jgi:hypothetical protein